jgi:spore maturation protein CgeB
MKLLIIGSDKVFSIENFYYKYFKELGVEVKRFTAQAIFYDYYFGGGISRKILFKLGFSNIHKKINKQFIDIVDTYNPSVIWVFKGMEISPDSLQYAKQKGIKLANYNPDNPFIFTGVGSGNKNITNSIDLYDLHFTYNLDIKKQLEEKHHAKTALLPFAFDISQDLYAECKEVKEINKACFLGNPDKQRAEFILALANLGAVIDVYGHYWNKFIQHKNITIFDAVYEKEQWKTLRKYRVQINIMRVHNLNSHNMRTFEVAGIGGIQLAPNTKEHKLFFEEGKEIFLFDSPKECVEKINYLTSLSTDKANELRNYAKKAATEKKHSYKDRAEFVLENLNKL